MVEEVEKIFYGYSDTLASETKKKMGTKYNLKNVGGISSGNMKQRRYSECKRRPSGDKTGSDQHYFQRL